MFSERELREALHDDVDQQSVGGLSVNAVVSEGRRLQRIAAVRRASAGVLVIGGMLCAVLLLGLVT